MTDLQHGTPSGLSVRPHMTASDLCPSRKKALACRGPSTHGAASYRAKSLEPASSAIPTAAADKQHYDDDDQKSCRVHIVLLKA